MRYKWLTLTALLPGSAFAIHDYVKVPEISGVLLHAGKPQPNASVYLGTRRPDKNDFCKSAQMIGTTDASGFFHIDPVVKKKLFPSLLNPTNSIRQMVAVCFSVSDSRELGVFMIAPTSRLLSIHLVCSWDGAKVSFNKFEIEPASEYGICTEADSGPTK